MEFQALVKSYLNHCAERSQLAKRSLERYSYLLEVFRDFLIIENRIVGATLESYLNGITPEEIFRSLEYYISRNSVGNGNKPVKSEDTARLYVSVVKEFFKYQNMIGTIQSSALIHSFGLREDDTNSFTHKYNAYLAYLHKTEMISGCNEDKILTEEEVFELISCCNENLNLAELERLANNKDAYNRVIKALAVKLILLTGVKVTPTIKAIKKKDLDLQKGTLNIGIYPIHLPFHLRLQFQDYMKICRCKADSDPLFLFYNNEPIKEPNELVSFFSYRTKISSIKSLAKYAIVEMIDAGLDKDTILEFTRYGNDVYKASKEIAELDRIESRVENLDKALKGLSLFDML